MSYTQIANDFIDTELPRLSASAVCIYLVICRRTIGWHKQSDVIALSQFMTMTGMSKPTVIKALRELTDCGIISVMSDGLRAYSVSTRITLNASCCGSTDKSTDGQESLLVSKETLLVGQKTLLDDGQENLPQSVKKIDTQKKEKRNTKKKEVVQRDERLQQWQFTTYRELTHLHVPFAFRDAVAQLSDERIWRDVITRWIGRGYRPNGISGMLDWYKKEESNVRRQTRQSNGGSVSAIEEYIAANEQFLKPTD